MKKEHFKNLVLVVLIITNFMLTQRIFSDKKLWLFGYNFFSNIGNSLKNDDYLTALHLAHPEKIYVNTGYQSSRFVYSRGSEDYDTIYSFAEPVIHKALSSQTQELTEVTKEEWYSILSGKSIYMSFMGEYTPALYSLLLGISEPTLPISTFSHMAISEDGDLYIMDNSHERYYRIRNQNMSIAAKIEKVLEHNSGYDSVINYSYELNFDKDFGDQKTFISPMVPVYSSPIFANTLFCENPIFHQDNINTGAINRILSVFSFNPSTVRRYTEADGTLVYVENNGVLRISVDGVINFTANDTGIELDRSNHTLVSLARLIDGINSSAAVKTDMSVTSSAVNAGTYTFDYIIGGYPVKFESSSAVTARVSDGYLKEYTHILRSFSPMMTEAPVPMFIESLDETITDYQDSMNRIHITEMYPAYSAGLSDGELLPDWYIEIDSVIAE